MRNRNSAFLARFAAAIGTAALAAATLAPSASAELGIAAFDGRTTSSDGTTYTTAGGHPHEVITEVDLDAPPTEVPPFGTLPVTEEPVKTIAVELPPGLVGNADALPQCKLRDLLLNERKKTLTPNCPLDSMVGNVILRTFGLELGIGRSSLFNMEPPVGSPARFAFQIFGSPVLLEARVRSESDYGIDITTEDITTAFPLSGVKVTFWGTPADPSHDGDRCLNIIDNGPASPNLCAGDHGDVDRGPNPAGVRPVPLITLPASCSPEGTGLPSTVKIDSWLDQGNFSSRTIMSHEAPGYPLPESEWGPEVGTTECDVVPFDPEINVQPASDQAETPTGLEVQIEMPTEGLLNQKGIAQAQPKKVEVTLPEGVTINPSAAEGAGYCSPSQYQEEQLFADPDEGCPDDSKIGSVRIDSPLVGKPIEGFLYLAQPNDKSTPGQENPFDSLIALYIVARNNDLGLNIKLPGKVVPDPKTGKIVSTFDDLPQLPFERFSLKFREGARAVLTTPPTCGNYTTEATFIPWSAQDPDNPVGDEIHNISSTFDVNSGPGGGPCPSGGVPPFKPGFEAGSLNNNAGSFSPFNLRLTRGDGEQDMTKFSAVLPPGVIAKIAGTTQCSDAAIEAAKRKTGKEELANPSCPASSQIGRILAGAGVGSVLTYVPGKQYLAGPFAGAPLSEVVITPAVAGPFDVGVVVNRQALALDPKTGQVIVDGDKSDPIPHILQGIPLKIRDVRVYADKPDFTINPTSCNRFAVQGELWGSFLDPLSPADDAPVDLSTPYQAANCALLGFKPRLSLKLKGGTKRGGHPGLRAVLRARPGDANVAGARVTLPRSAFLDQAHIRTICTRVQFADDACPAGAIYGFAKAFTPLLDEPLSGPAYLRSSNHQLPDLVFDLHGLVDIEVAGRIDSFKGGIRTTFADVPDAPISKFLLTMQGGKKGLVVNSRDLCASTNRAAVRATGQNGKVHNFRPLVQAKCERRVRRGR